MNTLPDLDFDDLDAWLAETISKQNEAKLEEKRIARARKKLLTEPMLEPTERELLRRMIEEYDEKRTWETVAQVAIINVYPCDGCGHSSRIFAGWYREQLHRHARATRRLVAGESPLKLPLRREYHLQRPTHQCVRCLDSYIRAKQALIVYTYTPKRKQDELKEEAR